MTSEKFQTSIKEGKHHAPQTPEGDWEGTTKTRFPHGTLSGESLMKGTMKLAPGGRFVLQEYTGTCRANLLKG